MPLSHICPTCLHELARVRAIPDPHYGLPIVVCPGCQRASVRTRHPDRVFWQRIRRARKSIIRLLLTLQFTALSTGAVIGMVFWVKPEITTSRGGILVPDIAEPAIVAQMLIFVLLVGMCGCIARAVYSHRAFATTLGLFALLISFFLTIDASIGGALEGINTFAGAGERVHVPEGREIVGRMLVLLVAMPIFIAGMGVGSIVNVLIEKSSSKSVSKIRRRLQRRRKRHD